MLLVEFFLTQSLSILDFPRVVNTGFVFSIKRQQKMEFLFPESLSNASDGVLSLRSSTNSLVCLK